MIKRIVLVIAGLSVSVSALAMCESEEKSAKYHGALFDAMAQIDRGMYDQVLAKMDKSGVQGMALFGRLTHKSNGDADVLALKKNFPQKFIIGTPKWFDLRGDVSAMYLRQTLSGLRDGPYQFVGEIMFAHGDKSHGEQTASGERFVSADKPNVLQLMQELQALQAPVMTHWEVYNWNRDWPAFHALYGKFPQLTFIWPHAGFGSAAQVETVLSQHENVIISLSKTEKDQRSLSSEEKSVQLGGAMIDDCGVILPEWRALLDRFPTRFMFATDAHKDFRWDKYGHIVSRWRRILGQLPDEQAQMIAWKNAERVYGKPR
ncbi:amidohydrolase family protein [Undibacterium aquatile]|uniref:Amidohydrolase family protein n=1 Tax=Undibacterium aquatile TaxID=1537398 RepID=A0ABR6XHM2_9BURK|nr:amidohydrolase family protein [Undibacterium aquatile]MBC3811799.1 amidohydrolase family protein [Undibacterium aquatile]